MIDRGQQLAIGVDVGATKIASILIDSNGQALATRQEPTEATSGSPEVLTRIASQIEELQIEAQRMVDQPNLIGIGIGTPGQVYSQYGLVRNAVNLGWGEINLRAEMQKRLPVGQAIWIQNDANANALGEYYFGAGRGYKDLVYIGVGSGLGGGALTSGCLLNGAESNALEIGHFSLDPQGDPCACGLRGCAETIVSGPGLVSLARKYRRERRFETKISEADEFTTQRILQAAQLGDPLSRAALDEMGRCLGIVLAVCVAVLNPAVIVIGGGLGTAAFDAIIPPARRALALRTVPGNLAQLQILPSMVKFSAVGAACLPWYYSDRNG